LVTAWGRAKSVRQRRLSQLHDRPVVEKLGTATEMLRVLHRIGNLARRRLR
jgi:hypothetical protein